MTYNPYQPPSPFSHALSAEDARTASRHHSGLGIASFVIALGVALFEFVAVVAAGVIEVSNPGGMDEESPQAIVIGLCVCGGLFLDIIAIVLGFAALFQSETKKLFAILGLVFAFAVLLGVVLLMILGTMAD
jgi:hypothetical protein